MPSLSPDDRRQFQRAWPLARLLFLVPPAGNLILVLGPQAWLAVLEEGFRG